MSHFRSAVKLFFATPELVSLVLRPLQKSHLAFLIRVNSALFHQVAPHLWADVPGLEVLLRLMLPKDHPLYTSAGIEHNEVSLNLVLEAPQEMTARFKVYMNYVRILHVYGTSYDPIYVNGQRLDRGLSRYHYSGFATDEKAAMRLSNCHTVIIDQLESQCPMSYMEVRDVLSWFVDVNSCISLELLGRFARRPHRHTPAVGILHPQRANSIITTRPTDNSDLHDALRALWPRDCPLRVLRLDIASLSDETVFGLAGWLSIASEVHTLRLSPFMLSNELYATIGRLSHLRHLQLSFRGLIKKFKTDLSQILEAPEDWSAPLSELTLNSRNWKPEALIGLIRVPRLFMNLTTIALTTSSDTKEEISRLFIQLTTHAPRLSCLDLRLTGDGVYPATLDDLAPLLSREMTVVKLGAMCLSDKHVFNDLLQDCPSWKSSLKCLAMPDQSISHTDLLLLAEFSALQELTIGLDNEQDIPELLEGCSPISPSRLLLHSHFILPDVDLEWMQAYAAFLLACWCKVELAMIEDSNIPSEYTQRFDLLTEIIDHLRCETSETLRNQQRRHVSVTVPQTGF